MKPMHGRLVTMTQGPITFEGVVTAGDTEKKLRGFVATFQVNLSTIRIDESTLPEDVDIEVFEQAMRAMYPGLIVIRA